MSADLQGLRTPPFDEPPMAPRYAACAMHAWREEVSREEKNMRTIGAVVLAAATLGALALACGGSGDDGGGSNSADMTAAPASSASAVQVAPGDYMLDNDSVGATLTIKSATAQSIAYSLSIVGKTGSHHNGELDNRKAAKSGVLYADTVDSDCKISLAPFGGDSVQLKQTGSCSNNFGAFLDASGTYKVKTASKSGGWVGLYEHENTHRAWAIRITSESPFSFHLVAGHLEDSSDRIDFKGTGTVSADSVLFENGPDCAITFTKQENAISVSQSGRCEKINLPDDLFLGEEPGTNFNRLDEKECFDKRDLAVGPTKNDCADPL
jgi:hypothetical protein